MTVTSNIHVGLAGWSNTTYSVGQRRSNAGNAYQVTTAGTSTAPPTGTGTGITPGGTSVWKYLSSVDYTTLQAWANGIPSTLTQPIIGLLWNDGVITAVAGTSILSLTGHTTSGSNTITLVPATGEGFLATFVTAPTTPYVYNNANGISIEFPATGFGGINYIQVDDSNVIFRGLQIKDLNASSGATMIGGLGSVWIDKTIVDGQSQSGGARMIQMGGGSSTVKITNSLIIDRSIGSPTSATVEAVGTGCVIVCSTFIKTAPASPSAALDANTNPSVASNIVRNCIFVGYATPFIAAATLSWATDHNAYTNATFTSGSSATDTGGSIYSATTSTLFVNATTDYHQNSSSPCLDTGVADTTDITTADDTFGTTRPQGTSWDIGPHELLVGHTILRDMGSPIEFGKGMLTRSFATGIAFGSNQSTDKILLSEYRNQAIYTYNTAIEYLLVVSGPPSSGSGGPFSGEFSGEFGGNGPFSGDFSSGFGGGLSGNGTPMAIEWRAGVNQPVRDAIFPLAWGVSASIAPLIAAEWRSQPVVDNQVWIELSNNKSFDRIFPASSVLSVLRSVDIPYAFGMGVQRDIVAQTANYALVSNSQAVPVDWGGISTVTSDVNSPLDWRSNLVVSKPFNIDYSQQFDAARLLNVEWINTAVGLSVNSQIDWRNATLTDARNNVDWQTLFVDTSVVPTDFVLSAANTRIFPMSMQRETDMYISVAFDPYAIISLSSVSSFAIGITANRNAALPLEMNGGAGDGAKVDAVFHLEIGGGAFGLGSGVVEIKSSPLLEFSAPMAVGSVSLIDYRSGSAWLSTPLSLTISPVEWSQLVFATSRDAAIPIEILTTVNADINPTFNLRVGQEAIGAYLQPDAWEEDNEPC